MLQGQPVRLVQGRYDQVLHFGGDAVELARTFAAAGAPRLHVIDLDGARSGSWCNLSLVSEISRAVDVPVQVGGGARDRAAVAAALALGVERVIMSTAALADRELLRSLTGEYREAIAVSLDVRAGGVMTDGWTVATGRTLLDTAEEMVECGVARLIHTDVARDGTLAGADLGGLERLLPLGIPVVVAGGVRSYTDLKLLQEAGAEGAVVGRALLEGGIDLGRAISLVG